MQTDKAHDFAQTMMLMCNRYQQTPSMQMLNGFWQLTQRFGLTHVQQVLQTYRQQPYGQYICPTPTILKHLLADKTMQNRHTSPRSFFNHRSEADLTQCIHLNSLKTTSLIAFKS